MALPCHGFECGAHRREGEHCGFPWRVGSRWGKGFVCGSGRHSGCPFNHRNCRLLFLEACSAMHKAWNLQSRPPLLATTRETRDRAVCEGGEAGDGRATGDGGVVGGEGGYTGCRKGNRDTGIILEAAARTEELGSSHPGCDGASIRWRNRVTAYKGNKERLRQRIFICPSSHSQRRCFITGSAAKLHFSRLLNRENLLFGQQGGQ